MVFLNDPEGGGQTAFPNAAVKVTPRPGNLLIWNNMDAIGQPNPYSLHQGMPGRRRHQICHHQMVSRAALGLYARHLRPIERLPRAGRCLRVATQLSPRSKRTPHDRKPFCSPPPASARRPRSRAAPGRARRAAAAPAPRAPVQTEAARGSAQLFHESDEASLSRNPLGAMFRGDFRYADRLGDFDQRRLFRRRARRRGAGSRRAARGSTATR